MSDKSLPTVTVALSAYNEEKNIEAFLHSVLTQRQEGFILEHIWVYDDGSTDHTVQVVTSVQSLLIEVITSHQRTGKSHKLNEIYSRVESDILVQSDADIVFKHPYVIRDIIRPLVEHDDVYMCGGHPQPVPGKTFTERAVNCTCEAFMKLRSQVRDGNNVLSVDGRLLAYKKKLLKQITVPEDMIANDAYTYFCCLRLGYAYHYVPSAGVLFRSPNTLADQIRQNTRFVSAPERMRRYFDPQLVDREYYIPPDLRIKNYLLQYLRHPILCTYIFLVNRYCQFKSRQIESTLNAKWAMAVTTKDVADS